MAFPVLEDYNTGGSLSSGAAVVTVPSGNNGDLLLLYGFKASSSVVDITGTDADTFSDLAAYGTGNHSYFGTRIIDGTEGASMTFYCAVSSAFGCALIVISDWADFEFVNRYSDNDSTPEPPTNTPSWPESDTLWLNCLAGDRSMGSSGFQPPTDYAEEFLVWDYPTNYQCIFGCSSRELRATTQTPGRWDVHGYAADYNNSLLAIQGASAKGGGFGGPGL